MLFTNTQQPPQCCLLITGATTNSDSGVTDIARVLPALRCVGTDDDVRVGGSIDLDS